jgi:hypothetical protein
MHHELPVTTTAGLPDVRAAKRKLLEGDETMLSKTTSSSFQQPGQSVPNRGNALPATCLICRLLWPTSLPHRHLQVEQSSEAITLLRHPLRTRKGSRLG